VFSQWARTKLNFDLQHMELISLEGTCKGKELRETENNRAVWLCCRLWSTVWELCHQLGDLREFIQQWSYTIDYRNFRDPVQRLLSGPTVQLRKEWANSAWDGIYCQRTDPKAILQHDPEMKRLYHEHARAESRTGFRYFFIQPLLDAIFYLLGLVPRLFCDPRSFRSEYDIAMRAPAQLLSFLHTSLLGQLQHKSYIDEFGTYYGEKFKFEWTVIHQDVYQLQIQQSARGGIISAVFALLWKRKYFALMRILGIISLHYFDIVTDFYMIYQYFKKGGGDSTYYQYASIGVVFTLLPIFVTMYVQKKWQQEEAYLCLKYNVKYNGLPAKRRLFKDYVSRVRRQ
jgi:hypothetical protein